jgi:quercetin dioxygenase-like cupin family protein
MSATSTTWTRRSVLAGSAAAGVCGLVLLAASSGRVLPSAEAQNPVSPVPAAREIPNPAAGAPTAQQPHAKMKSTMTVVSKDSVTIAGEAIAYPGNLVPEVSSAIMTIPPGTTTQWMTHPNQIYIYVLEGTLTVEFADGPQVTFKSGQAFLQTRTKWHRGRNEGDGPVRFLAVSLGAKDVPIALHPPEKP